MIVCADENVAPALTNLLRETIVRRDCSLMTVDDYGARGEDDRIWVRRFAEAGGDAILGGDAAMTTKPHEVIAIMESGLSLVVLPQQWMRQKLHIQIAYAFLWWPRIEQHLIDGGKARSRVLLPWSWDLTASFKPIALDLQKAYSRVKREATRRS